ncbi:hypothetical protein D917_10317, partial [Trichinella nativa]
VVHERVGVVELPASRYGKGVFDTREGRTLLVECWIEDKVPAKASSINGNVGISKNNGDTKAVSKKPLLVLKQQKWMHRMGVGFTILYNYFDSGGCCCAIPCVIFSARN